MLHLGSLARAKRFSASLGRGERRYTREEGEVEVRVMSFGERDCEDIRSAVVLGMTRPDFEVGDQHERESVTLVRV